jgi:hypothetical protein
MTYTRHSPREIDREIIAIVAVDLESQMATGIVRHGRNEIQISYRHAVGEVDVVPTVGEQWYAVRFSGVWRLDSRIPFQYPALAIKPTQGQVKLGSGNGPVELVGTQVNVHGPLRTHSCASDERPPAADAGVGAQIYDITLHKPIWSDGTQWRDAAGSVV